MLSDDIDAVENYLCTRRYAEGITSSWYRIKTALVELGTTHNSAMDAMQRLTDKMATGCDYGTFYGFAQSIINEYRAARHQ